VSEKVILYARVSTRDKDQTPETQLHALRQYAAGRDWEIVEEYVDTASAGDLRGRSRWRDLLKDVQTHHGQFGMVLVTKLDRAFRSVKETYSTLEIFTHHKIGFVATTQDSIDTTSSTGRLMLGLLATFAEFERDLISERVKEGMARAKAEGKHVGRQKGAKDKKKRRRAGYFR